MSLRVGGGGWPPTIQYGEWRRADYEAGLVPEPQPDPDLAPLLSTVLTGSVALVGPPARDLIDPVPHADLVAAMRETLPSLLADLDTDTTNVLLTLARMWRTTIVGKDGAASWALDRLPPDLRPPLAHARAVNSGIGDASFQRLSASAASTADHIAAAIGE